MADKVLIRNSSTPTAPKQETSLRPFYRRRRGIYSAFLQSLMTKRHIKHQDTLRRTVSRHQLEIMSALTLWLVVVVVGIGCSVGDDISPPIPVDETEPGIRYNPATVKPKVTLEIFIDLNCPYSNDALPVVKQVADHYGNSKLDLVVQQLVLPYHRNAFLCTQGLYLIEEFLPATTFAYMEAVLARSSDFSTANTVNKTETEVLDMLADIAVASTGVDEVFFKENIKAYRSPTTRTWKYAVSRTQAGTPSYSVNGVDLISESPSFNDWIEFLDPLINGA